MTLRQGEVGPTPFGPSLSPVRAALDLAARAASPLAIARVDQVLRAGSLLVGDLARAIDAHPAMRGIRQARAALDLVGHGARDLASLAATIRRHLP